MADRKCKWCGADISHRHLNAKFCNSKCRLRYLYGGAVPGDVVDCKNCGRKFVKTKNEKHCSAGCREEFKKHCLRAKKGHRWLLQYGPPSPRVCVQCGRRFSAFSPNRKYCVARGSCSAKAWRHSKKGQAYYDRFDVKERILNAQRKHSSSEHGKAAQKLRDMRPHNVERRRVYRQSEHGKRINRELQRRRKAEAALSAILLPTHSIKEE